MTKVISAAQSYLPELSMSTWEGKKKTMKKKKEEKSRSIFSASRGSCHLAEKIFLWIAIRLF